MRYFQLFRWSVILSGLLLSSLGFQPTEANGAAYQHSSPENPSNIVADNEFGVYFCTLTEHLRPTGLLNSLRSWLLRQPETVTTTFWFSGCAHIKANETNYPIPFFIPTNIRNYAETCDYMHRYGASISNSSVELMQRIIQQTNGNLSRTLISDPCKLRSLLSCCLWATDESSLFNAINSAAGDNASFADVANLVQIINPWLQNMRNRCGNGLPRRPVTHYEYSEHLTGWYSRHD